VVNNKHIACAVVAFSVATGFLSGCSTAPTTTAAAQSSEAFNKSMAEADQVASTSDKERATRQYQQIASANPSRGEPWSRIAQIHFEAGNYGLAIVAAEETLKRDPSNRQAKSVTAVGGLRLAARSLEDLRKDSSLTGDTTADAQRLAQLLRETLGTSVLVPATDSARSAPARRAAPRPASSSSAASATSAASTVLPSAKVAPISTAGAPTTTLSPTKPAAMPPARPASGNPFDALK
jgi:hypothetical protein